MDSIIHYLFKYIYLLKKNVENFMRKNRDDKLAKRRKISDPCRTCSSFLNLHLFSSTFSNDN